MAHLERVLAVLSTQRRWCPVLPGSPAVCEASDDHRDSWPLEALHELLMRELLRPTAECQHMQQTAAVCGQPLHQMYSCP